jgi:NADH:ubiquinone oxidoreductase subunit 4 (subunit M)
MTPREIFIFAAMAVFIVWIGIYPNTFLKVSDKSTAKLILQVNTPSQVTLSK